MSTSILTQSPAPAVAEPMSWPRVVAWHLLPGLALTGVAIGGGAVLDASGLQPIWALLGGVIVVQVPLLLVLSARIRDSRPPSIERTPLQRRSRRVRIFAATLVAALLLPGLVAWSEPFIRGKLLGWLPDWWSTGSASFVGFSTTELAVTLALWLLGPVLLGPVAEELYFRGALLPRIPSRPWVAAVASAALFASYHLWQPYTALTVFLFALPIAIARARFAASTATCAAVHCLVNLGMFGALLAGAVAR